jgi:hypothetical protein
MWWVSGIAVAFVLMVVCVIALGRSTTARWERAQRAARARRRHASTPPPGRPPAAARLRHAVGRAAAPGVRAARVPLTALAPILTTARTRVLSRHRLVPHVRRARRSAAADRGTAVAGVDGVPTRAPEPDREPEDGRPVSRAARVARHGLRNPLASGLRHPARRLPARLVHRHDPQRSTTGAEDEPPR